MEYIATQRNSRIAVYHNFLFTKEREQGNRVYWRCKSRNCTGRIHVINDEVVHEKAHNHLGNRAAVLAFMARMAIKDRAADSVETSRQIFQRVTQTTPLQAKAKLPAYRSLQRDIQRTRKRNSVPLPAPATLADIDTNQRFNKTHTGEKFLLHDTGSADVNQIIVFSTDANIKHLMKSETWLGDGTFSLSRLLYTQVYTVHGVIRGSTTPLVYAMLPNKTADTYHQTFQIVYDAIKCLSDSTSTEPGPKRVIVDFEKAAIKSFSKVFTKAKVEGCTFHFGQSLFRKIQECGLATQYGDDVNFSEHCKLMLALALAHVPPDGVLGAWEALQNMPGRSFKFGSPLDKYFMSTYNRTFGTARSIHAELRKKPRFDVDFWSCYDRVVEGVSRTTNAAEAWHLAFQRTVGAHHPSIYTFFCKLQDEQGFQETAILKLTSGNEPPKQKRKYRQLNERIAAVVGGYDRTDILDYLKNISYSIEIDV